MELLDGEHLHKLAPLPWPEACALLRDVCSAVALLHSRRWLHRDLSPKNVQRTSAGRAKLIDFGTMAPMGPSKTLVGTPPLVPPEALLQQPLDASADLYAIGATLYYALTGKHAYPAHDFQQLGTMWRTPPPPPSALVPGIPSGLDQLVLGLLSLEPLARPSSAAEVLDRLSAIADLPRDEHAAVSRAYLATPQLVARAEEVASVRGRLAALHAQQGGVIAIEGAAGMGRSRMLDTLVLEAKLSRMAVVRANAADGAAGTYGTLGALVRQLRDLHAGTSVAAAHGDALALLAEGGVTSAIDTERRPELQRAFHAQLQALASTQPVVIAIDDLERCDAPSLAALAVTAADTRRRVLIAVSCQPGAQDDPADSLAILMHDAKRVPLHPLGRDDSEALLASVFGEVPHLQHVAARVHERAEGTPRGCMELSQYLLDRGLVRYEMGGWVLPSSLADADLPGTLSGARRERLAGLSGDARELAEALALSEGAALDVEAFAELTSHGDPERVRSALDELMSARVLRSDEATYLFEAQPWRQEIEACLAPAGAERACGRIADALAHRGRDRLEVAAYRLRGGQAAAAIELVLEELAQGSRWNRAPPGYDALLRGAIDACGALSRPRSDRMVLLRELIKVDSDLAAPDLIEHTLELLAELRHDSGLDVWGSPGGPTDTFERLGYVSVQVQERHAAAAAHDRGFEQFEAIVALGVLVAESSGIAARTGDARLIELLPSLAPFHPFSSALEQVDAVTVPACRAVIAGRYEVARALYAGQLASLLEPSPAYMPAEVRAWGIRALHYAIGNIDAGFGRDEALVHAAEIEQVPGWAVPAYSIKQSYYLTMGNLREAERCRRQSERSRLQSPVKPPFAAAAVVQNVFTFAMTDNLNGMRTAIPQLEALARSHPGIRPFVPFARAEHARICGDHEDAHAFLDRAHQEVQPGDHPIWPWLVSCRLFTLLAQGRYQEARAIGLEAVDTANRVGLTGMRGNLDVPLALNEAKLSDFASACARIDPIIEARMATGSRGVALGSMHEARARIALWMNDPQGYEHHAQLCAQHLSKSGGEPAVVAKYERLLQDARQHGVVPRPHATDLLADHTTIERTATARACGASVDIRLGACASRGERAVRALELLVSESCAQHGELFLVGSDGLVLAASTTGGLGGAELIPLLSRIADSRGSADTTVVTAALELHGPPQPDGSPTSVWPLLLVHVLGRDTAVAGVATLHFAESAAVRLPAEVASAVAAVLIEAGDVVPHLVCGPAAITRS
jgi:hypothetical protein